MLLGIEGKNSKNSVNFKNWDNKLLSREIKCIHFSCFYKKKYDDVFCFIIK